LHEIAQDSEDLGLEFDSIRPQTQFAAMSVKREEAEFVKHRVTQSRQPAHYRLRRLEIKTDAPDDNKSQRFSRRIMLIAIKALWDCG